MHYSGLVPKHRYKHVNLLLTELTDDKSVVLAKEIADLIKDVKKDPMNLRLWKLPHVQHWQDWTVVTMADQAHNIRPLDQQVVY